MAEKITVVVDPGSSSFKCGEAGGFIPRIVIDSVVGRPKFPGIHPGMGPGDSYIGDEALTKRLALELKWVIDKGRITDMNDFSLLFSAAFEELGRNPEECNLLLSEAYQVPVHQRENLAETLFEKYNIRGFNAVPEALLATYGAGKTTSLVVDFGEHKTDIIPIYEAGNHSMLVEGNLPRCFFGGSEITDILMRSLAESGFSFSTHAEREIVKDIKEKLCYCAFDFEEEQKKFEKEQKGRGLYTLPDGTKIMVKQQRFICPEAYFRPSIIGKDDNKGVHEHVCDLLDTKTKLIENIVLLRQEFAQNIILVGGGSMIPGLAKRLEKEISPLANKKWEPRAISPEYRKFFTWYGGSILAPLIRFVTRDEFEEKGATAVNSR